MKAKLILAGVLALTLSALVIPAATAGNPHQIGSCTVTISGSTLSASCKEAGLGDESQIDISFSGDALCINPGTNHPKANNKQHVSSTTSEPVQNGKADFTLTVTATFQPDCTPPMTVEWQNVTITDTTNGFQLYP